MKDALTSLDGWDDLSGDDKDTLERFEELLTRVANGESQKEAYANAFGEVVYPPRNP